MGCMNERTKREEEGQEEEGEGRREKGWEGGELTNKEGRNCFCFLSVLFDHGWKDNAKNHDKKDNEGEYEDATHLAAALLLVLHSLIDLLFTFFYVVLGINDV